MAEFLDTNILLYAYDPSEGARHAVSRDLVLELSRSKRAVVSVQVLQEFYVNAVVKILSPLSPAEGRKRLAAFSRWNVHSPIAQDVVAATTIAEDHGLSFWDAMIIRSAAVMGCEILWSEDMNHGQVVVGVEIRSPLRE